MNVSQPAAESARSLTATGMTMAVWVKTVGRLAAGNFHRPSSPAGQETSQQAFNRHTDHMRPAYSVIGVLAKGVGCPALLL